MQEFVERHGLQHVTHAADTDGRIWQAFEIAAQPAWVFIDGQTGDAERVLGSLSEAELVTRIEALVADP